MVSLSSDIQPNKKEIVTIQEYRVLLNDNTSTEEQIKARLDYLEGFFRRNIRKGLEKYVQEKKLHN